MRVNVYEPHSFNICMNDLLVQVRKLVQMAKPEGDTTKISDKIAFDIHVLSEMWHNSLFENHELQDKIKKLNAVFGCEVIPVEL